MLHHGPLSLRQRIAGECLWALGCLLAVATLYVTVVSNMRDSSTGGLLNVPATDWAVLWNKFLGGHFWIATGVLYGLVQVTRLTMWAVTHRRVC
jgi:hypothetical protein